MIKTGSAYRRAATLMALLVLGAPLVTASCSGDEFKVAPGQLKVDAGGGTGGTGGTGGSGGSSAAGTAGSSPGKVCDGPEDCEDGDPCTVNQCGVDSRCVPAKSKCGAAEKCCDGACGECCADTDCDDKIGCTADKCVAGYCTPVPDDSKCAGVEYCSAQAGCREREPCPNGTAQECDDGQACTTDRCETSKCFHDRCPNCCNGTSCATQCCSDSQCNDNKPCTKDKCESGSCQNPPLCAGAGIKCCESAGAGSCGKCCSATDCNDSVACTDDTCGGTGCVFTPNHSKCAPTDTCHPTQGCIRRPECGAGMPCPPRECNSVACVSGTCAYTPSCAAGQRCCPGSGCRTCCDNTQCDDSVSCTVDTCGTNGTCSHVADNSLCTTAGTFCDVTRGCIHCATDADCDDQNACTVGVCNTTTGSCFYSTGCMGGQQCCPNGQCQQCCSLYDCCYAILEGPDAIIPPPIDQCPACVDGTCTLVFQPVCSCGIIF